MSILNVFLMCLILIAIISFFKFSFGTFFAIFFFICHSGSFFIYGLSSLISGDFNSFNVLFDNISVLSSVAFFSFAISYFIFVSIFSKNVNDILYVDIDNKKKMNFIAHIFMIFWVLASVSYLLRAGVSFDAGDYEGRLEKNAGNGFFIMFMVAYIPAVIIYYLKDRTCNNLIYCCLLAAFCGVVYFYVIGGSRNVFVAGMFILIMMGYYDKHIKNSTLFLFSLIGLICLNSLVFLRYGMDVETIDSDFIVTFLSYLADSISPVKALDRIITYYSINDNYQYFTLFFNKFEAFIPRFLWPDKPINTMTSAYFYTVEIYGLDGYLTMAPTILGSSIIMFGQYFFFVLFFIIGMVVAVLDAMLKSSKIYLKVISLMTIPFSFFLTRESLELFVFNVMKYSIVISICFSFALLIWFILPRKVKS